METNPDPISVLSARVTREVQSLCETIISEFTGAISDAYRMQQESATPNGLDLWSADRFAEALGCTKRALYEMRVRGEVPQGRKIGKQVVWTGDEIREFMTDKGDTA